MIRLHSLAFRLTAILAMAWLAFFLVLGALVWQGTQRLVRDAQADKTQALANQLATVSLDALLVRDYGTLERYLSDLSGSVIYAEVRRADGLLLGHTGIRTDTMEVVRAPMRIVDGDMVEVVGEVLAQYDPAPARRAVWQLVAILALGLALFAALTFWALRKLLIGQLVAPVTELIAGADPDREPVCLPESAPHEVVALAQAIAHLRARIGRHITEAEEAAQSRNEALRRLCSEQRLAAVGQIAGEVAHELNTPLSNMLGYAQSALPLARDPEVREALEVIESQARRGGQIVRDMLTAARAPAPSLQTLDLAQVSSAFIRLVTPLVRKQGAAISQSGPETLPTRADPALLEQILFNLVFNALQAGATQVVLTLAMDSVPSLAVTDNGPGLPESVRRRLFEPFVTTKPAGQGTGLGLAICQRLAREMGAELNWIARETGTEFQVRFLQEHTA